MFNIYRSSARQHAAFFLALSTVLVSNGADLAEHFAEIPTAKHAYHPAVTIAVTNERKKELKLPRRGVFVIHEDCDTPLEVGDLVYAVGGKQTESPASFYEVFHAATPGEELRVLVLRPKPTPRGTVNWSATKFDIKVQTVEDVLKRSFLSEVNSTTPEGANHPISMISSGPAPSLKGYYAFESYRDILDRKTPQQLRDLETMQRLIARQDQYMASPFGTEANIELCWAYIPGDADLEFKINQFQITGYAPLSDLPIELRCFDGQRTSTFDLTRLPRIVQADKVDEAIQYKIQIPPSRDVSAVIDAFAKAGRDDVANEMPRIEVVLKSGEKRRLTVKYGDMRRFFWGRLLFEREDLFRARFETTLDSLGYSELAKSKSKPKEEPQVPNVAASKPNSQNPSPARQSAPSKLASPSVSSGPSQQNSFDGIQLSKESGAVKQPKSGGWRIDGDAILNTKNDSKIILPTNLPASYNLEVEFVREQGGESVIFALPAGDRYFLLALSQDGGAFHGISNIRGLPASRRSDGVFRPGSITNSERQKLVIQVSSSTGQVVIVATLNNQAVIRWSGAASELSAPSEWSPDDPGEILIGVTAARYRFERISISPK